jgi:hypothetical protein
MDFVQTVPWCNLRLFIRCRLPVLEWALHACPHTLLLNRHGDVPDPNKQSKSAPVSRLPYLVNKQRHGPTSRRRLRPRAFAFQLAARSLITSPTRERQFKNSTGCKEWSNLIFSSNFR